MSSLDDLSDRSSDASLDELAEAEREWQESLVQLQQVISVFFLPYVGKWLGRKFSYSLYARYATYGLGSSFFAPWRKA